MTLEAPRPPDAWRIDALDPEGSVLQHGTAWLVTPGTLVTAWHVVDGAAALVVQVGGHTIPVGPLLHHDALHDLALLEAPADLPADLPATHLPLGPLPEVHASWTAPGFPAALARELRVPGGAVRYLAGETADRRIHLHVNEGTWFEQWSDGSDSPGWGGISGAPVLVDGRVVGVLTNQGDERTSTLFAATVDRLRAWTGPSIPRDELALRRRMRQLAQRVPQLFRDRRRRLRSHDLFVQLSVDEDQAKQARGPRSQELLLEHVLARPGRRWVLRGDPGAGKTTLLNAELWRLLEHHPARLPLLVTVAALRRHGSLAKAIEKLVPGAGAVVERAAEDGRLTVLLDGFDEVEQVGDAEEAVHALDAWLVGADNRLLVAGRPVGFDEAQLADEFGVLRLRPLSREGGIALLKRRRVEAPERLYQRLEAELPATAVGNPLMLTLAAMVCARGSTGSARTTGKTSDTDPLPITQTRLYHRAIELLVNPREDMGDRPCFDDPDHARLQLARVALSVHGDDGQGVPLPQVLDALTSGGHERAACDAFLREAERVTRLFEIRDWIDGEELFFSHRTLREFLAALALDHAVRQAPGGPSLDAIEQHLGHAVAAPGAWAEVLAHLCGLLSGADPEHPAVPGMADALLRAAAERSGASDGGGGLAYRVAASAEGLDPALVVEVFGLGGARALWQAADWDKCQARSRLLLELRERIGSSDASPEQRAQTADATIRAALGLARSTTHGADLWHLARVLDELEADVGLPGRLRRKATNARHRLWSGGARDPAKLRSLLAQRAWCPIPVGSFRMGSPQDEEGRYDDEGPQHTVHVREPFWMLDVPITNAMYACFDPDHEAATAAAEHPDRPAADIGWWEAAAFAEWVGVVIGSPELPGADGAVHLRLPTETEWEYACRAGTTTRWWFGDDESSLDAHAWFRENSDGHDHPVGQKPANPWGLYDMHGNVDEWCTDEWQDSYEHFSDGRVHVPSTAAPTGGPSAWRVIRGGSAWNSAQFVRSAYRVGRNPSDRGEYLGFRLVAVRPPVRP